MRERGILRQNFTNVGSWTPGWRCPREDVSPTRVRRESDARRRLGRQRKFALTGGASPDRERTRVPDLRRGAALRSVWRTARVWGQWLWPRRLVAATVLALPHGGCGQVDCGS
ncbi:spidroin-1-like [Iris pallida]|uniref:Spidroin-1-like n=1 Tax=Iris pallida TaxID=29817 RepID=A0AAX6ERY9_IRIPA|nr:spidroin-1-like [Iris pallida]